MDEKEEQEHKQEQQGKIRKKNIKVANKLATKERSRKGCMKGKGGPENEAAAAYDEATRKFYCFSAKLNFPLTHPSVSCSISTCPTTTRSEEEVHKQEISTCPSPSYLSSNDPRSALGDVSAIDQLFWQILVHKQQSSAWATEMFIGSDQLLDLND
ncbi:hypothetical protein O6P43_007704 [Quillaja saponaria]|uniref:Uncharacterized protein n=1 Tax=Quillaja saponaria TaxID=32244 RepID=A0AAD7VJL3_QUISA|nr:hypothetical protein O6P43_007704 [Quillaja saponaria]